LPAATGLCELNQVHGTTVVEAQHYPAAPEADACYSRSSDWACVVRTADCLPLLLCSRSGDEVAAVHAGWRGLATGVIEATLVQLNTAPEDLLAWMGPAIGPDNFEVGAEVRSAFLKGLTGAARQDASACFTDPAEGKYLADLYGLARSRLNLAGVAAVYGGDLCSFADTDRFYSWRRQQDTGRMYSVIYLK
jgi:YfiH family protein